MWTLVFRTAGLFWIQLWVFNVSGISPLNWMFLVIFVPAIILFSIADMRKAPSNLWR